MHGEPPAFKDAYANLIEWSDALQTVLRKRQGVIDAILNDDVSLPRGSTVASAAEEAFADVEEHIGQVALAASRVVKAIRGSPR